MKTLIDTYGRHIDYLRISVTDHCNLRCSYCTPFSGRAHLPRVEILSYEEMYRVAKAAVLAGITKIRITGGEPLVRRGLTGFCKMLSGMDTVVTDINLTRTSRNRKGSACDELSRVGFKVQRSKLN